MNGLTWSLTAPKPASMSFPSRGDDHSLAAFDDAAFMVAAVSKRSANASGLLITKRPSMHGAFRRSTRKTALLHLMEQAAAQKVRQVFCLRSPWEFRPGTLFQQLAGRVPPDAHWKGVGHGRLSASAEVAGAGCGENQPMGLAVSKGRSTTICGISFLTPPGTPRALRVW